MKTLPLSDLYEQYGKDVFRYAFSILKDEEEAKDAVQEAFVKYAKSENSFKGDCSQKTWLLIITRNYCFNRINKKDFNNKRIDEETKNYKYEIDLDSRISLKDALMMLSEEHNELLYLKEYEGYSYKEISEITEQSIENVKIKLFRARKKLREILR